MMNAFSVKTKESSTKYVPSGVYEFHQLGRISPNHKKKRSKSVKNAIKKGS